MKKLEKAGVVKIHSAIEFGKGCVEYLVEDSFSGRLFQHTEYPLHWNTEKIVTETMALYTKAVQEMLVDFSKTKPIETMTSEGFNLKMIADKAPIAHQCASIEGTLNKHIITARPHYQRLP